PIYYDDYIVIQKNMWVHQRAFPIEAFQSFYVDSHSFFSGYRPILIVSYWINAQLGSDYVLWLRLGNILLHALNALLIYFLVLVLAQGSVKRNYWRAFGISCLFAVHPSHTVAINMLWKRSSLLVTFWMILGCLFHLWYNKRPNKKRFVSCAVHFVVFILALLTKESAIIYPVLIMLLDHLQFKQPLLKLLKERLVLCSIFVFTSLIFMWCRLELFAKYSGAGGYFSRTIPSRLEYLSLSARVVPQYIYDWIIQNPLVIDDPSAHSLLHQSVLPMIGLLAVTFSLIIKFGRDPLICFGVTLFWLGLLPTSSFYPLFFAKDSIRTYLPYAGLSMILVSIVGKISSNRIRKIIYGAMGGFGVVLLMISTMQNWRYGYPTRIWKDVVDVYPESTIAWNELGAAYVKEKEFDLALNAYRRSLAIMPSDPAISIKELQVELRLEGPTQRIRKEVERLDGNNTGSLDLINLALLELDVGLFMRANRRLLSLVRTHPRYAKVHFLLGISFERLDDERNALGAFQNAVTLDPNFIEAKMKLDKLRKNKSSSKF
ncbi:MAG: tetratricopeptide repeat protein, partial [Bdellovibrionales bacterium]|nr:tetratricopeptide repeat protein [Bdellovibrionales bacterium]